MSVHRICEFRRRRKPDRRRRSNSSLDKIACTIFFIFQFFNGISLFQQQCKRVQWLPVKILKKIMVPLTLCLPWKEILVIYFIALINRLHFTYCLICNMFHGSFGIISPRNSPIKIFIFQHYKWHTPLYLNM